MLLANVAPLVCSRSGACHTCHSHKQSINYLCDYYFLPLGNIFYTAEYRDTFLLLLRKFHMTKHTKYRIQFCCWKKKNDEKPCKYDSNLLHSRSYLRDLIEAFHIFLKMLEIYCSGKTHIVVQVRLNLQGNVFYEYNNLLPGCHCRTQCNTILNQFNQYWWLYIIIIAYTSFNEVCHDKRSFDIHIDMLVPVKSSTY